jgi:16S rRNA (cytidine1402-2'-O)-methyltransferase
MRLVKSKRYRGKDTVTTQNAQNPLSSVKPIDPSALHVVSVPIGNVKDFSLRALEVLKGVDYIICTNRHATRALLEIIDVDHSGRLIHARPGCNDKLVELLREGRSVALVCPSGTPCVGDDGNDIVREMMSQNVRVCTVPGPSSVVAALSISGVLNPTGRFYFGHYLSEKGVERQLQLQRAKYTDCPSVFFDVPHRLLRTLEELDVVMPTRRIAIAHELTKVNESLHSGTAHTLLAFYRKQQAVSLISKGQLVLIVEGSMDPEYAVESNERLHQLVCDHLKRADGSIRVAVQLVASAMHLPFGRVQEAYQLVEGASRRRSNEATSSLQTDPGRKKRALRRRLRFQALVQAINRRQESLKLAVMKDGVPKAVPKGASGAP